MFMFLFYNIMLCLKINYIREKKFKEQFIENIVFLLFYLSVLSWDCNYSHSLLILLFYFILKKKHIPTDGLKLTLNIVFSFSFKQTYRILC